MTCGKGKLSEKVNKSQNIFWLVATSTNINNVVFGWPKLAVQICSEKKFAKNFLWSNFTRPSKMQEALILFDVTFAFVTSLSARCLSIFYPLVYWSEYIHIYIYTYGHTLSHVHTVSQVKTRTRARNLH